MADPLNLFIDGMNITVPAGFTVAAAITLGQGSAAAVTRQSVSGDPRGPLCGMGICQECRVTIDGIPHRLACQTLCTDGMRVVTDVANE